MLTFLSTSHKYKSLCTNFFAFHQKKFSSVVNIEFFELHEKIRCYSLKLGLNSNEKLAREAKCKILQDLMHNCKILVPSAALKNIHTIKDIENFAVQELSKRTIEKRNPLSELFDEQSPPLNVSMYKWTGKKGNPLKILFN